MVETKTAARVSQADELPLAQRPAADADLEVRDRVGRTPAGAAVDEVAPHPAAALPGRCLSYPQTVLTASPNPLTSSGRKHLWRTHETPEQKVRPTRRAVPCTADRRLLGGGDRRHRASHFHLRPRPSGAATAATTTAAQTLAENAEIVDASTATDDATVVAITSDRHRRHRGQLGRHGQRQHRDHHRRGHLPDHRVVDRRSGRGQLRR